MTVFINARFLSQPLSGVQRYARELTAALDRRLAQDAHLRRRLGEVIALCPPGAAAPDWPDWTVIGARTLPGCNGHVWEQLTLGRAARGGTLLSLCGSGPLWHTRHVVAFHDANLWNIPAAFDWRYRLFHRTMRPRLARRAAARLSVSDHAAASLEEVLGVKGFTIVPNSAEHALRIPADPAFLAASGLRRGEYLLAIGSDSPNKNLARLLAAHRLAGPQVPPLIVAGGGLRCLSGSPDTGSGVGRAQDRCRFLGRLSDGALRALYEGAAGFVFPSLYEGFGIPPLEAMTLDVPVLAAQRGAMPEVLGTAALWFDPTSVPDIARALSSLTALSPTARADLVAKGRVQAARYSWDVSAARLIQVLEAVVRSGNVPRRLSRNRPSPRPVSPTRKPEGPCAG